MSIEIYTDGSVLNNPGSGSWAFVAIMNGKVLHEERSDIDGVTTNNRAEMTAIIKALEWLGNRREATVHSDSQVAVNVINRTWKAKANCDLALAGSALLDSSKAKLQWIRGHAGHPGNERADALARSVT